MRERSTCAVQVELSRRVDCMLHVRRESCFGCLDAPHGQLHSPCFSIHHTAYTHRIQRTSSSRCVELQLQVHRAPLLQVHQARRSASEPRQPHRQLVKLLLQARVHRLPSQPTLPGQPQRMLNHRHPSTVKHSCPLSIHKRSQRSLPRRKQPLGHSTCLARAFLLHCTLCPCQTKPASPT